MKKISVWLKLKAGVLKAGRSSFDFTKGKVGERVIRGTSEMKSQLGEMGRLGGQLFVTRTA